MRHKFKMKKRGQPDLKTGWNATGMPISKVKKDV